MWSPSSTSPTSPWSSFYRRPVKSSFLPFDLPPTIADAFDLPLSPAHPRYHQHRSIPSAPSPTMRVESVRYVDPLDPVRPIDKEESFSPFGERTGAVGGMGFGLRASFSGKGKIRKEKEKKEKRGTMVLPILPPPPTAPGHGHAYNTYNPAESVETLSAYSRTPEKPKVLSRVKPPRIEEGDMSHFGYDTRSNHRPSMASISTTTTSRSAITAPAAPYPSYSSTHFPPRQAHIPPRPPRSPSADERAIAALEQLSHHLLAENKIPGFRHRPSYENGDKRGDEDDYERTRAAPRAKKEAKRDTNVGMEGYVMVPHPRSTATSGTEKKGRSALGQSRSQGEEQVRRGPPYVKASEIRERELRQAEERECDDRERARGGDRAGEAEQERLKQKAREAKEAKEAKGREKERESSQSASMRGWRKLRPTSSGGKTKDKERPISDNPVAAFGSGSRRTLGRNGSSGGTASNPLPYTAELPPVPSIVYSAGGRDGDKDREGRLGRGTSRMRSISSSRHLYSTPSASALDLHVDPQPAQSSRPPIPPRAPSRPSTTRRSSSHSFASGLTDIAGGVYVPLLLSPGGPGDHGFGEVKAQVPRGAVRDSMASKTGTDVTLTSPHRTPVHLTTLPLPPIPSLPSRALSPSPVRLHRSDGQPTPSESTHPTSTDTGRKNSLHILGGSSRFPKLRIKRSPPALSSAGLPPPVHPDRPAADTWAEDPIAEEGMRLLEEVRKRERLVPRTEPRPDRLASHAQHPEAASSGSEGKKRKEKRREGMTALSFLELDDWAVPVIKSGMEQEKEKERKDSGSTGSSEPPQTQHKTPPSRPRPIHQSEEPHPQSDSHSPSRSVGRGDGSRGPAALGMGVAHIIPPEERNRIGPSAFSAVGEARDIGERGPRRESCSDFDVGSEGSIDIDHIIYPSRAPARQDDSPTALDHPLPSPTRPASTVRSTRPDTAPTHSSAPRPFGTASVNRGRPIPPPFPSLHLHIPASSYSAVPSTGPPTALSPAPRSRKMTSRAGSATAQLAGSRTADEQARSPNGALYGLGLGLGAGQGAMEEGQEQGLRSLSMGTLGLGLGTPPPPSVVRGRLISSGPARSKDGGGTSGLVSAEVLKGAGGGLSGHTDVFSANTSSPISPLNKLHPLAEAPGLEEGEDDDDDDEGVEPLFSPVKYVHPGPVPGDRISKRFSSGEFGVGSYRPSTQYRVEEDGRELRSGDEDRDEGMAMSGEGGTIEGVRDSAMRDMGSETGVGARRGEADEGAEPLTYPRASRG